MRWIVLVGLLLAGPAVAQSLPGGISPSQAMLLYQALTPQQRTMLATNALRGKDSLSPTDALAWYQSMTPQQKQMAKDMAKQQAGGTAGLKDMIKGYLGK
jgi:hypothetical protein